MSLDWILLGLRILSTVILYVFLGLAFFIIWRDLKVAESQRIIAEPPKTDQLRLLAAAEETSLAVGATLPLQPVTILGRAPESTIVLTDVSVAVRHACLSRKNGVWWLEDLGSQNGTLLNNLLLVKPTALTHGDVIVIGGLYFRLETASAGL